MSYIPLGLLLAFIASLPLAAQVAPPRHPGGRPPNFLIFLCDNLGYGDTAPYGSKLHRTPNLDRLAKEGRKFTHFYTSANVCTPSRVGLMTACYAQRASLYQNARNGPVLQPGEPIGLHPDEVTIAEVLKPAGYATMLIGKWHLGDQPVFLPTRQGFDEYWGIPYSDTAIPRAGFEWWPPLPLMRGEIVIEAPVDRDELTRRETAEAIRFITDQRDKPFLLIISHAMPGSSETSFASEAFRGRSRNGRYGDAVEELDWSAGEVMTALQRLGLADNTLVIWTADNAASPRSQRGTNAPLSGFYYSTQEGGVRVPFLARWPGQIPAGTVCDELSTMMDLLPTFATLAGVSPPANRVIDGKNIWPLLAGKPGAHTPHEAFYYYHFDQLQAVRSGPWKLFLPLVRNRTVAAREPEIVNSPARLYNVVEDPGEHRDVVKDHTEVVARLLRLAEAGRHELGDLGIQGRGVRPAGWVFHPQTQRMPNSR